MNIVQKAVKAAQDRLQQVAGTSLIYKREGAGQVTLRGVAGSSQFNSTDASGVTITYRTKDWIVPACDLVFGGQQAEPKNEDEIHERVGNKVVVYVVRRPEGGEAVYRYSDSGRSHLRIHCVEGQVNNA